MPQADALLAFISYSRTDGPDFVYRLRTRLRSLAPHLTPWSDFDRLPGTTFPTAISRALRGSAVLLFVMTPESVRDKNPNWCQKEALRAYRWGIPILPLQVVPRIELPFDLEASRLSRSPRNRTTNGNNYANGSCGSARQNLLPSSVPIDCMRHWRLPGWRPALLANDSSTSPTGIASGRKRSRSARGRPGRMTTIGATKRFATSSSADSLRLDPCMRVHQRQRDAYPRSGHLLRSR